MIVVRTEVWSTKSGNVAKAVGRDEVGRFLGLTNNTGTVTIPVVEKVVGKK